MLKAITDIALLVHEYDEAIAYYVGTLGFELLEDKPMGNGKRWVAIAPPGSQGVRVLLARATTDEQKRCVGRQTGGRVFLFLTTDDFKTDYANFKARGVEFTEEPRYEPYGTVVVFKDLYGNLWDFIEKPS